MGVRMKKWIKELFKEWLVSPSFIFALTISIAVVIKTALICLNSEVW